MPAPTFSPRPFARRKTDAHPWQCPIEADRSSPRLALPFQSGKHPARGRSVTATKLSRAATNISFLVFGSGRDQNSGARICPITSFLVGKEVEVRVLPGAGHVLASDADEGAGETRKPGHGGFVGQNAGVELLRQPAPVVVQTFDAIREVKTFVVHFHAQVHKLPLGHLARRRRGAG